MSLSFPKPTLMWRTHSCVPRRDSSRRPSRQFATFPALAPLASIHQGVELRHYAARICDVHAYAVMTNCVPMLIRPKINPSRVGQRCGRMPLVKYGRRDESRRGTHECSHCLRHNNGVESKGLAFGGIPDIRGCVRHVRTG